MPRSFNCCQFNHPCPIFCPLIDFTCSNNVQNPNFVNNFAFFNNTAPGTITSGGIIPVSLVTSQGASIVPGAQGTVLLQSGIYEVNYFANGTIPAGGQMSVNLSLNGVDVAGSEVSVSGTVGDTSNLTRTIVVTLFEPGTLALESSSAQSVDFAFASMFIRRL